MGKELMLRAGTALKTVEFDHLEIIKLTLKKWAKLAKVSLDTAARDVKQLAEAGILVPGEGRFRNVPYGIVISNVWVTDSWPAYTSHTCRADSNTGVKAYRP